jgi:hypothetical protein
MNRLMLALPPISLLGLSLSAQAVPVKDSLAFDPVGKYRLDIQSPYPMGTWTALVVVSLVHGHYEGTFRNPSGPETYPVTSVAAAGDSLTITMGGEGTGSIFSLAVKGDSVVGTMTSIANGLTQVRGLRLKQ